MGGTKFLTGEANRLSKKEFQKLKEDLEKYQREKYPELENSIVHSKPKRDRAIGRKNTRQTDKEALTKLLENSFTSTKNMESFFTTLQSKNFQPYYRNEKLTGVKSASGMKFRFKTMGIDKQQLYDLEEKENQQNKELDELQSLRNSSQENSRDDNSRGRFLDDEPESQNEMEDELAQTDDYER